MRSTYFKTIKRPFIYYIFAQERGRVKLRINTKAKFMIPLFSLIRNMFSQYNPIIVHRIKALVKVYSGPRFFNKIDFLFFLFLMLV